MSKVKVKICENCGGQGRLFSAQYPKGAVKCEICNGKGVLRYDAKDRGSSKAKSK